MKTLLLGKKDSLFYKNIEQVISLLDSVVYKSEHDFPKVAELVDFVKDNNIGQVLMPNPYGNNKRLACYRKLKECNIPTIASDRGALPDSWFFDSGFNFDSDSYHPKSWDFQLTKEEEEFTQNYINTFKLGNESLEKQGTRIGGEALVKKLGLENKNIVFVPLQRPNDTVIKFFAGFAGSVPKFIDKIHEIESEINHISNNWVFLLKKHPLETEYFPTKTKNIMYVSDDTNVYDLIEASNSVILINSGVGINSLLYGKKVLCLGDAFYAHNGLAISCKSIGDVIKHLESTYFPDNTKLLRFTHHLLTSVYSFGKFHTKLVSDGNAFRNETYAIDFYSVRFLGKELVKKKKILILSPLVPFPIYRGNQARIDAVIRGLAKQNFSIELVVLNTSFKDKSSKSLQAELEKFYPEVSHIKVFKDPKFDELPMFRKVANFLKDKLSKDESKHSISNNLTCPNKVVRYIDKRTQDIDFDYLLLNYAKTVRAIPSNFKGKVIIDTHDYQSAFLQEDQEVNKKSLDIDLEKFRASEHVALNKADVLLAINPLEAELFKNIAKNAKVITLPAFAEENIPTINFATFNFDVLYVGSISNFNVSGLVWFLDNVLPHILITKPDIKIAVAGNIARTKEINWSDYPNVKVLGIVPDLSPFYISSCCCIAPILGGAGMKIKVIEALSYSKAIVATAKAVEGINYTNYKNSIAVTDSPEDFALKVLEFVNNKKSRELYEMQANKLFNNEHSVSILNKSLSNIFE